MKFRDMFGKNYSEVRDIALVSKKSLFVASMSTSASGGSVLPTSYIRKHRRDFARCQTAMSVLLSGTSSTLR